MSVKFPNRRVSVCVPPDMIDQVYHGGATAGSIWRTFDLPDSYLVNAESKRLFHKPIITRAEVADAIGMTYFLIAMLVVFAAVAFFSDYEFFPYVLSIWVIFTVLSYMISFYKNLRNRMLCKKIASGPNSLVLDADRLNILAVDSEIRGTLWIFDQVLGRIPKSNGIPQYPLKAIMVFEDEVDLTLFKIAHGPC